MNKPLILVAAVGLLFPPLAPAVSFTLADGNSSLQVDSQSGAAPWYVDGVNHLFSQWFWYRVGNTAESSIGSLALNSAVASDANLNGLNETLAMSYAGNGFTLRVDYQLAGGSSGSGAANLSESILIVNTGSTPLDFHFFQHADFDLNGQPGPERASLINANTVRQFSVGGGTVITETVANPAPSRFEIAQHPFTGNHLNDGAPSTLAGNVNLDTGDLTWAFQWDTTIAAGGSFRITKDKQFGAGVPDASSTALLLVIALGGLIGFGRRIRPSNAHG